MLPHFLKAVSDQGLTDSHPLIFSTDSNRSQDECLYSLLESQPAEEYGANQSFCVNRHKSIQVSTGGTGNQVFRQVTDQGTFAFVFSGGEHRYKKLSYGG